MASSRNKMEQKNYFCLDLEFPTVWTTSNSLCGVIIEAYKHNISFIIHGLYPYFLQKVCYMQMLLIFFYFVSCS